MTTPPIVSITDELIQQLDALTCLDEGGAVLIHSDQVRTLLAERAELKRDAERLRWLCRQSEAYGFEGELHGYRWSVDGPFVTVRAAIDAAMQAAQ